MTTRSIVARQRDDNAADEASRLVRQELEVAARKADELIRTLMEKSKKRRWF
jgi:hypothetical protein